MKRYIKPSCIIMSCVECSLLSASPNPSTDPNKVDPDKGSDTFIGGVSGSGDGTDMAKGHNSWSTWDDWKNDNIWDNW